MAVRPNQRQLFRELTAKFGVEVAEAFADAIRDLTSSVEVQKLQLSIEAGDLEAAMQALHLDRTAFAGLEAKIAQAFVAGGQGAVASMPASVSIGFRFDPGNQRAASWIQRHAGNLITGLWQGQRDLARTHLAEGMAKGLHPRDVALNLVGRKSRISGNREGGLIGLSGPQRAAVEAARIELASQDPAVLSNFLSRKRRVKYPFDGAVKKAIAEGRGLSRDTAAAALRGYQASLLKLRGEVIARTEGLPAIRAAKREAYQQLIDEGRVEDQDVERGWSTIRDGRDRKTHGEMDGQVVRGMSTPFMSPSGAMFLFPGDRSLGASIDELACCRCDDWIRIRKR